MMATFRGNTDIVRQLLQNSPDDDKRNSNKEEVEQAMAIAKEQGHERVQNTIECYEEFYYTLSKCCPTCGDDNGLVWC